VKRVYSFGPLIFKELNQIAAYRISDRILEKAPSFNFFHFPVTHTRFIPSQGQLRI